MNDTATDTKASKTGYRVLARKYRPSDFTALVGQEPMVRTLTNAFESGRIAQAWMLTGVRGVGKTTTARILARALNYKTDEIDQPSVDLSVPGEHCQAILEGRHVDVIEMDAASHTGVDNMRDILERVHYAPVSARYKVYIIDEVHMLSGGAFNAMLKTLEEPPPHVKFIFATTEIRKVPITILSRCQRFDLRRIDASLIKQDLARIGGLEGVETEDDALAMIARAAEGSMRDAQSIFDQAIAHSSGKVTAQTVRDMLGLADRAQIIDLFEHIMKGDTAAALAQFRTLYDAGAEPAAVLTSLAEFCHLVTRLRFVSGATDDASLSEDERTRGAEFSAALSVRVLSRTWQMLLKGITEVQGSTQPVSAAEMVLIRLAHAADLPTLDEALAGFDRSGGQGTAPQSSNGSAPRASEPAAAPASAVSASRLSPQPAGGAQTMRLVEPRHEPEPASAAEVRAEVIPHVEIKSLADIAALADANRDMQFKILLKRYVRPVRIQTGKVEVSLTDDAPKLLLNDLSARLKEWTGRNWIVSLSREEGGQTLSELEEQHRENVLSDARSDPAVAAILSNFPGAKIIDVRIPDAGSDDVGADLDDTGLEAPDEDDDN
ncbi:DNA polymerase III subunit gamma/tau [Mesorhizobium sp. Z1-4]|uniref:DNA polymerase III subunit gamma/tau n=1 Tax=Mesorhizobium sp. Z1-4 TaxID=2448478 RepID=UPI000FD790FF|nr:DNA polymerase III subunit gamma/tau [Mesorhizobium sp. Z1-4]